jgi:hypothetical protein
MGSRCRWYLPTSVVAAWWSSLCCQHEVCRIPLAEVDRKSLHPDHAGVRVLMRSLASGSLQNLDEENILESCRQRRFSPGADQKESTLKGRPKL